MTRFYRVPFKSLIRVQIKRGIMQLLVRTPTVFKKVIYFFAHKKLKKTPSKVAQNYSNFFSPWAAQKDEFMFQNVAYRPTVYIKLGFNLWINQGPLNKLSIHPLMVPDFANQFTFISLISDTIYYLCPKRILMIFRVLRFYVTI